MSLGMIRDFWLSPHFSLRLGAKGSFASQVTTVSLTRAPDTDEPTRYPGVTRSNVVRYGGVLGFGLRPSEQFAVALSCDVLSDIEFDLFVVPKLEILFMRAAE